MIFKALKEKMSELLPFERKSLLMGFGLPLLACLVVTFSLAGCNNSESCGNNAWKEDFWGDPFFGTPFCEETKTDSLIGEKENTLSNFSYIYFGLVVLWISSADKKRAKNEDKLYPRNIITMHYIVSMIYGISMLYLGFGSFIFHASGNDLTYAHDQASIFVHFIILIGMALSMYIPLNSSSAFWQKCCLGIVVMFFIGTLMVLNLAQMISTDQALNIFFGCVVALIVLILANLGWRFCSNAKSPSLFSFGLAATTVILFILALIVQEQFVAMPCHPNAFFQFHALWHVLTGIGFFVLYLFFRSNHFEARISPNSDVTLDKAEEV